RMHLIKRYLGISFLMIYFSLNLSAQVFLKTEAEIKAHADEVMRYMGNNQFDNAFEELDASWPFKSEELGELKNTTKSQFAEASVRFGKIIGSDFIKEQKVGDYLLRRVYVLRFERHMLPFYIRYYRSQEGWLLSGVTWNDQIDKLFE
ncbi:MAG: hypothetical protein AAFU64_05950, partial [Bacteroidota bacterium]